MGVQDFGSIRAIEAPDEGILFKLGRLELTEVNGDVSCRGKRC